MRIAHAMPFTDLPLNIAQILARGLEGLPENDGSRDWMENVVAICLEAIAEAVQAELGQIPRERHGGSSSVADWLDGFTHSGDH
jgi:hypothetical protein